LTKLKHTKIAVIIIRFVEYEKRQGYYLSYYLATLLIDKPSFSSVLYSYHDMSYLS